MAIPESQLETWSRQGAVETAEKTHESIRCALRQYTDWPKGINYAVYLQGSYKNDTNIRGDSDVDVVVQLNSTFQSDTSSLSEAEQYLYKSSFRDATYGWHDFRSDVLQALRDYYDYQKVNEGKKSLKVKTPYLPADVVVCIQYRKYRRFRSIYDQEYIEGMTFYVPSEGRWVVNYPKLHYKNGVAKNGQSGANGWYKPTVRLFKNARTYLIDRNVISDDLAPSYFLECLLYNVPNDKFGKTFRDTFWNIVNWLLKVDLSKFVCQNEQLPLFGGLPEQWSVSRAKDFLRSMLDLWKNWR